MLFLNLGTNIIFMETINPPATAKDSSPHQPHGHGIRGLSSHFNLDKLGGKYTRLFGENLTVFSDGDLNLLADAMSGNDLGQDGVDPEESHIPAGYTYFGQFVDHDITFDPETFAQQKSDPRGITNFRSPKLDLDNVYGRGPNDQPYLYDGLKLMQGEVMSDVANSHNARDLPRSAANSAGVRRAIIGDPRNDENGIISQLQGMMLRFHNKLVDNNPGMSFDDVQQIVRWHYQWIVLHDWLPRIVEHSVLDSISTAIVDTSVSFATDPIKLRFLKGHKEPKMPVEFSVAAYRLGHSMVRPSYRVNENTPRLLIFDAVNPFNGLNAFGEFPHSWTIDWNRFLELGDPIPGTDPRMQLAYKIDTSMVEPLSKLPLSVAGSEATADPKLFKLAFRNLRRGQILKLPFGQHVAVKIGETPLKDEEILIGPANDNTTEGQDAQKITDISTVFAGKCPLWVYILAESRKNFYDKGKAQLGPVGGTIVAETFLSLLQLDGLSFLSMQPDWKPTLGTGGNFTLSDLIKIALTG